MNTNNLHDTVKGVKGILEIFEKLKLSWGNKLSTNNNMIIRYQNIKIALRQKYFKLLVFIYWF